MFKAKLQKIHSSWGARAIYPSCLPPRHPMPSCIQLLLLSVKSYVYSEKTFHLEQDSAQFWGGIVRRREMQQERDDLGRKKGYGKKEGEG